MTSRQEFELEASPLTGRERTTTEEESDDGADDGCGACGRSDGAAASGVGPRPRPQQGGARSLTYCINEAPSSRARVSREEAALAAARADEARARGAAVEAESHDHAAERHTARAEAMEVLAARLPGGGAPNVEYSKQLTELKGGGFRKVLALRMLRDVEPNEELFTECVTM